MTMPIVLGVAALITVVLAVVAVRYFFHLREARSRLDSMESLSQKMLDDARREAETLKKEALLQAKDQLYQMKLDFEADTKERRQELNQLERRLTHKEETLDKRSQQIEGRELEFVRRETQLEGKEKKIAEQMTTL